ncbi:MAG: SDR family NAD(P)-dependent oxidoreductase [Gemmatimonadales bacterium]
MRDPAGLRVVVTGANSGVGRSTAELLAAAGASVVMVCRTEERGRAALEAVRRRSSVSNVQLELADLSSLRSVRDLAARLRDRVGPIDVLVNNAGVYRARRQVSEDGFEMTMAVNHLGHFLLTNLLVQQFVEAGGLVISVSSDGHRGGDLKRASVEDILRGRVPFSGFKAYADSKLANVLFAFELSRRTGHAGLAAAALHPGVLSTRIWHQNLDPLSLMMRAFKPLMNRPSTGGKAVCRLVVDCAAADVDGRYFHVEKESKAADQAYDRELAQELWDESARLTGMAAVAA